MFESTKQNITKSISTGDYDNMSSKTILITFDDSHLTTPYEKFSIMTMKNNVAQITVFEKQTHEILSIAVNVVDKIEK